MGPVQSSHRMMPGCTRMLSELEGNSREQCAARRSPCLARDSRPVQRTALSDAGPERTTSVLVTLMCTLGCEKPQPRASARVTAQATRTRPGPEFPGRSGSTRPRPSPPPLGRERHRDCRRSGPPAALARSAEIVPNRASGRVASATRAGPATGTQAIGLGWVHWH